MFIKNVTILNFSDLSVRRNVDKKNLSNPTGLEKKGKKIVILNMRGEMMR